jgi:hypothetical protein
VGETRVDILHLLEDLRDAYPGSLEETVVTEIVANSLDSGAARIAVATDPSQNALLVTDDGTGMKRRELARFGTERRALSRLSHRRAHRGSGARGKPDAQRSGAAREGAGCFPGAFAARAGRENAGSRISSRHRTAAGRIRAAAPSPLRPLDRVRRPDR